MEINLIIRELLAKHNFVSLPGIGSFIQRYEPAFPSSDGKSFIPPKQLISFDTTRVFNDEAIENYLCEKQGISHSEASDLLKIFIDKLNYDLNSEKPSIFDNVGELFKNKKGKIKFEQAADIDAALSTFGLKPLVVEKVTPKKTSKAIGEKIVSKNAGEVKKGSSSKVLVALSLVIVIGALAATFILIPDFRFWEKYLKPDQNIAELKSDSLQKNVDKESVVTPADSAITKTDSVNEKIEQNITDNNVKKTALYYQEPKVQGKKTYYLIVGSFGKVENAEKLSETFKQKGYNPEIIQGSKMFRVSIGKTADRTKALSDYNKYLADNPSESIWILGL